MAEIALLYNVDRSTISNKLKLYNIPATNYKREFSDKKSCILTDYQISVIAGSLLGDGSLIKRTNCKFPYFKIGHCEKQLEYLQWKKNILENCSTDILKIIDKRGNSIMYDFRTVSTSQLDSLYDLFYCNGKKVITESIKPLLNNVSLVVWFMDDGSCCGRHNEYRLSTEGFSKDENYILSSILKDNFDIDASVLKYSKGIKEYYYLLISVKSARAMTEIIKDHMVDCMKYKLIISI